MSFESHMATLHSFIDTNYTSTPVAYGGGVVFDSEDVGDWVKVSVLDGNSSQPCVGNETTTKYRFLGFINIVIYGELTTSGKTAENRVREYADTLTTLFLANKTQGNVLYRTPNLAVLGEADGYFSVALSVPFQRDEFI